MDKEKVQNLLQEIVALMESKNITPEELRPLTCSIMTVSAVILLDEKSKKSEPINSEKSLSENEDAKVIAFESCQVFDEFVSKFRNREISKILNNFLKPKKII